MKFRKFFCYPFEIQCEIKFGNVCIYVCKGVVSELGLKLELRLVVKRE